MAYSKPERKKHSGPTKASNDKRKAAVDKRRKAQEKERKEIYKALDEYNRSQKSSRRSSMSIPRRVPKNQRHKPVLTATPEARRANAGRKPDN